MLYRSDFFVYAFIITVMADASVARQSWKIIPRGDD